jgi:RNA polymerase sigma factor (sigma-70 family)
METLMDLADKWEHAQRSYGGKVRTFARNAYGRIRGYDEHDIEQELLVELWRCVLNYDPDKGGASFNTYFQRSAKNRIITLIRHSNTKSRSAINVSTADEAVLAQVDAIIAMPGAEFQALNRMQIAELVDEYGEEVLDGTFARLLRRQA